MGLVKKFHNGSHLDKNNIKRGTVRTKMFRTFLGKKKVTS